MSKDPDDLPPQAGQGHPLPRVPRFQRFLNPFQHFATQVGQGHHLRCRGRCRGWARTGRRRLLSRTGRLGGRPPRRRPTRSLPFALVLAALLQRRRPSPPLLPRPPRLPAPRRAHLLPRPGPRLRMKPTPALRAPSTRSMRGPAHPFRSHATAAPAVEAPPAPPPRHRRTHLLAIGRWRPEGPGGSARRRQVGQLLTATKVDPATTVSRCSKWAILNPAGGPCAGLRRSLERLHAVSTRSPGQRWTPGCLGDNRAFGEARICEVRRGLRAKGERGERVSSPRSHCSKQLLLARLPLGRRADLGQLFVARSARRTCARFLAGSRATLACRSTARTRCVTASVPA